MEHVKSKPKITHRQRQALATQALIVDTARRLFLEQGYHATTIEMIAAEAGVAVSTIYAIFRNKRGILQAMREAWHQESGQRDIYAQAREESDPQKRLGLAAHATRRQWETGAALTRIYNAAASADPEAAAELVVALEGRRKNLTAFIEEMAPDLRPELDAKRAAEIFLALTMAEIYDMLVRQRGWTPDEYETWLTMLLRQQLLP
ncbi:MAG TPA: helix-turn-helix domain-containing protein [Ktedonobacterales bacterium]|jgi:AcrR family transcriptional regulator|nr:helix-turn-helix domain-containing protein [Ktedonobacterales bacterium]